MTTTPNLYDTFAATSLHRWERLVKDGEIPSPQQLADIIDANADKQLPAWFLDLVGKSLRGKLRGKPGRPKQNALSQIRFAVAQAEYPKLLRWLKNREHQSGLKGWSVLQGQQWWSGPPHERAARIVTARWLRHMSWKSFLNRLSS
jgi:hypothetical protein